MAALLVGAGGGWLLAPRSTDGAGGTGATPATFGKVVRTDVQARTDLTGGLGHVADRTIACRLSEPEGGATLTGLAAQGTTVRPGGMLFSVDERPVALLLGPTPAWRTLRVGVVGTDVSQLERNLESLGYGGLTVDDTFTSATGAAVRRWQRDIGTRADGVVDLGEVVFLPSAVRIDQDLLTPGDAVSSGTRVLAVGPIAPVVTVDLEPTQLSLVSVGDRVIVRLAGGTETPGTVVSVGQEGATFGGPQPGETEAIPATVSLERPADAAGLAGSSATVSVVTDTSEDALAVPVTALLAVPGGYVVEVDRGDRIRAVTVTPGLFDGITGLVEIMATGLEPGDRVVVAEAGA
ncbi:MAG TPA: efflux RND transporter periplasmic adaptor subunit [Actinomycetota bacterium]|nr:efflux RND transporter periplasmic adaptor subunit [Actinomycetota bacterium]